MNSLPSPPWHCEEYKADTSPYNGVGQRGDAELRKVIDMADVSVKKILEGWGKKFGQSGNYTKTRFLGRFAHLMLDFCV